MVQTESCNYAAMGGISATALKIIGMIAMTIDHIGYFLFPQIEAFRIIGRIAYPIFAYMIAEGCRYTRNKVKYLWCRLRLFGGILHNGRQSVSIDSHYICVFDCTDFCFGKSNFRQQAFGKSAFRTVGDTADRVVFLLVSHTHHSRT